MTFELLIAFITFAVVTAITPGPNNMLCLASGLNYGFRRTIPHMLGIGIGFALMVFLAGLGLLSILDYIPFLYQVLHVFAIAYLLYLAWKIATASPLDESTVAKKKPMNFWQAVAFQWINPKALIMALAAITNYVPDVPGIQFFINITIVSILFGIISLQTSGLWTLCGTGFRRFLNHPVYYRVFNVTMAILLVLSMVPMLREMIA